MFFNLSEMEEVMKPGLKGGEGEVGVREAFFEGGKVLIGRVTPGSTIGLHTHEGDCEVMYIVSGTATFIADGVEEVVTAGNCQYCAEGHEHTLINKTNEDVVFFATVLGQFGGR